MYLILGLLCILVTCIYIHIFFLNNKKNIIQEAFSCTLYTWNLLCVYVYRGDTEEVFTPYGYSIL